MVIRALLVDDERAEYQLIRELLDSVSLQSYEVEWARSYDEGVSRTLKREHDVYLVDYRLGHLTGLDLIQKARGHGVRRPMLLITNYQEPKLGRGALLAGADEFLDKSIMSAGPIGAPLIDRTIHYAIERQKNLEPYENSDHTEITALRHGFWDWDVEAGWVYLSPSWKRLLGYDLHEVSHSADRWLGMLHPNDRGLIENRLPDAVECSPLPEFGLEYRIRARSGHYQRVQSQVLVECSLATKRASRVRGTLEAVREESP